MEMLSPQRPASYLLAFLAMVVFAGRTLSATEPPSTGKLVTATEIIEKEGYLAFTDGSSLYILRKDRTFELEPMGLSGRSIYGKWTAKGDTFTITGKWEWMNGMARPDDFRRLILAIYPNTEEEAVIDRHIPFRPPDVTRLHKVYFTIDELTKLSGAPN